jgi:hypothetical protein
LTVRDSSKTATAISGATTICNGAGTTLNLTGGSLGSGGTWKWYSNVCGGTFVGNGTSISLYPSTNTTYFVRAEGICNQTPCVSTTILVQDSSEPALGINGDNTICLGQKTTLNVIGGRLGVNANWKWYTGACGNMIMGSGANLTVAPTKTTTYYLRAEGTCNKTECISFIVMVQDTSMPAITISGNKSICLGQNTTLTLNGGSLGDGANWRWYSNSCGETSVGNGLSVKVNPTTTTTYYLRAEGFCNQTNCLTTNVLVQDSSIPANTINGVNNICIGQSTTLSLDGGKLGYLAEWNWYADDCDGMRVGKGTNIKVEPNTTTKYFVRAESVCNNTVCRLLTVIVNETPKLTAYNDTICFGEIAKPYVSGGVAYEWTPKNGIDNPNSNKPSIVYTSPISVRNNYPYIVKVTDWNRCVDSVTVMVVVNPLPLVDAGQDVGICPTDRTLLRASGANAYIWSPIVEFRTFNKDTASVSPKLNTFFKVSGIDNDGCRNTDSVLVKVYPRAVARAGEDDSICFGKTATLLGSGGKEYLWTGVNLTNPNSSNPTILPNNSTSYILRVIDDNGCRGFDTVNIAVINNPTPTITGKFSVCKNERGTEFYTDRTSNKFDWKIKNGKIQQGIGSNLILAHWNNTSDTVGNIEVTETLIQYPYCPVTVSKTVKIGGTISPTPPELVLKANNIETKILICPNCEFENYQWGYENKSNRTEIVTCKDIIWCKFDKIDTAKNYYWVKVGADLSCQTKAYFTPPNYLNVELKNRDESIKLYPNPTSTSFIVESVSKVSKIFIFNSVGELVEDVILDDSSINKYTINTTTYARGMYVVCVFDNSGRTIKKLILN